MNEVVVERFKTYKSRDLQKEREALREIVQEITLLGLWRGKFFEHAAFYGGTALRILYNLNRFSEDLDFTLLKKDKTFDLRPYCENVRRELKAYDFDVTVEKIEKTKQTSVESAFVKGETLVHLMKVGSKSKTTKGELLKVKFEVDTDPAPHFVTEAKQFFWPIPFSVVTGDLPSLFAGKLHATFCRDHVENVKGRDFYDFLWYVAKGTKPNYDYLEQKLRQSGHWPKGQKFTLAAFKSWAKVKVRSLDIKRAREDVVRFIENPKDLDGWTNDAFLQAIDRL